MTSYFADNSLGFLVFNLKPCALDPDQEELGPHPPHIVLVRFKCSQGFLASPPVALHGKNRFLTGQRSCHRNAKPVGQWGEDETH